MRRHTIARRALPVLAATLAVALGTDVSPAPAAPIAPHARHHLNPAITAGLTVPHAASRHPGTRTFLRASWR